MYKLYLKSSLAAVGARKSQYFSRRKHNLGLKVLSDHLMQVPAFIILLGQFFPNRLSCIGRAEPHTRSEAT